jgi:hypothetical protein
VTNVFRKNSSGGQCQKYEARLEDYLDGANDAELTAHIAQCAGCRAALEDSRLGGQMLREVWEPTTEWNTRPGSIFAAGVLARIREQEVHAKSPAAFWNPLEFLASRVSLTAAVLLLGFSVYLAGFAPKRVIVPASAPGTELTAMDFPQPPGDPDSNEEVLQSLVERNYGQ